MARELIVKLIGDSSSLERAFKRSSRSAKEFNGNMSKVERGLLAGTGAFKSVRGLAFGSSAFLGGVTVAKTIKDSVHAASDLQEQIQKTSQVFGENSQAVEDWAKTTTTSFGLSEREALTLASSFGALFKPIGLVGPKAAQQSEQLVQLGADLASFYNTDVSDALAAIQSGLVGQARPLRRYGVLLSEARVNQEALNETGKTNVKNLTDQEKVLARIALIYRDTKTAQGDFARTSGDLANQTKILKANVDDLEGELGKHLIPTLTAATGATNDLIDAMQKLQKAPSPRGFVEKQFGRLGFLFSGLRQVGQQANAEVARIQKLFAKPPAGGEFPFPGPRGPTPKFTPPGLEGPLEGAITPAVVRSAEQRNKFFDDLINRKLFRAGLAPLQQQLVQLGQVAVLIQRRIKVTKDITRKLSLEDQLLQVLASRKDVREQLAQQAFDAMQLKVDRAGLTSTLTDDLAALEAQKALVERQIKTLGDTVAREEQLVSIQGQINDLRRQRAANAKAAAQQAAADARAAQEKAQFAVLGLGPTGEELPPTLAALRREFQHVSKAIKGTSVDTSSNRSILNHVRKALDFSSLLPEVRSKIKELLDGINQAFDQGGKGFATKFKPASTSAILAAAGLDLSPDQIRRLRVSLAQVGLGGTVPPGRTAAFAGAGGVVITGDVHVHGVQNPKEFETALQKRTAARSHNRRGHR